MSSCRRIVEEKEKGQSMKEERISMEVGVGVGWGVAERGQA